MTDVTTAAPAGLIQIGETSIRSDDDRALRFRINRRGEWATIFVVPMNEAVELSIHSSFGNFAHCWPAIGPDSWQAFPSDLDFEYAMRKLAGKAFDVPLGRDEFTRAMSTKLFLLAREGGPEKTISLCREALGELSDHCPDEALFFHFNDLSEWGAYNLGLHESARLTKVNPQVSAFWNTLWAPFVVYLKGGAA